VSGGSWTIARSSGLRRSRLTIHEILNDPGVLADDGGVRGGGEVIEITDRAECQ
jgi:hypothetical protein